MTKPLLLRVLDGERVDRPPVWLMRQAGRYLPEYREVRKAAGSFLDLCFNPELATEVTLQPIRRFGFDAAILFSDILVVPHALGQKVWFAEGEGPRLAQIGDRAGLEALPGFDLERLGSVLEAVRRIRAALPAETALIGFCGAPWTVASYMIAGKGTPDQAPARVVAYRDPEFLGALIEALVEASIVYLRAQLDAGAQVVQIFESFAGALPPPLLERWSFAPIARIVAGLRATHPGARVIAFARGAGQHSDRLVAASGVDAVGLDWGFDLSSLPTAIRSDVALQGNLDPLALVAGGGALDAAIDRTLAGFAGRRHIFNLGHGIVPETPIAHVERMMARLRGAG